MTRHRTTFLLALVLAWVTLAYSNHFENGFHFDDSHTIQQNPYIRSLSHLPQFFTDPASSSVLPVNRTFRPLLFCSLALDYALGSSLKPFYFHLTTFLFYLLQVWLIFVLSQRIFDRIRPDPRNLYAALFTAALYGLHPAMAETVNYIIQRGDLYSTLSVIAALVVYIRFPAQRKYGFYLVIVAAGALFKPPALMFFAILFIYLVLIEDVPVGTAMRRVIPSLIAVAALGWLTAAMTPRTFTPGGNAWSYRITQPSVIARYFRVFFAPYDLSADTDRLPVDTLMNGQVIFGFLFLAALIGVAAYCARQRELRPIAFGLIWFLLALLPTSLQPLSEVENDHRIFFPFVGLAIAVVWAGAAWLYSRPFPARATAALCGVILLGFSLGTRERNKVWHSEESLWLDVTQKSPANGRGLMNYGLSQMAKGEYTRALDYFQRAQIYTPNYYVLEVNLGIDLGALGRDAEAEQHFRRAAALNPLEAVSHFFYGRWLYGKGRTGDAIEQLNTVIRNNPDYVDAPHLLMQIYSQLGDQEMLRRTAKETLDRFPADAPAASWLARAATLQPTPESYVNQSLAYYQQGRFTDSIHAAEEALKLRPGYALAWNNIAAAWNAMGKWDQGIAAGEKAVQAAPDNQLARNNLAWAKRQKALGVAPR